MKRALAMLLLGCAGFTTAARADVDPAPYAWWFPDTRAVTHAEPLVEELRLEVQRILDAGHLAPLYVSFADQESVGYTVHQEPGRILTTLAWAYPHLPPAQQAAVRAYVATELADPRFTPWGVTSYGKNGNSNYPLPRTVGTPRESHAREKWWYEHANFGSNRPFLHTLYGAWLWGHRTGDWTSIDAAWPAIRQLYNAYADTEPVKIYGTLGAHLAVLRLAERANDSATRDAALRRLREALTNGLDFAAIETATRGAPGQEGRSPYGSYPNMYDARMNSTTYHGWMFLNLTPEIGRYLRDESPDLRAAVLTRHAEGKARFPLWWLPKANYFNRSWTGDEGSGLVPEVVGMMAPVERWVADAPAATLAREMRGAPNGLGDCYWLEALVQAIEAHGTSTWHDVRYPRQSLDSWRQAHFGGGSSSPTATDAADPDGDGFPNLLEYALGSDAQVANVRSIEPGFDSTGGVRHFSVTFPHAKAAWDAEVSVEVSDDGVHWDGLTMQRQPGVDRGATETAVWVDPRPAEPAPVRFYRLSALRIAWP